MIASEQQEVIANRAICGDCGGDMLRDGHRFYCKHCAPVNVKSITLHRNGKPLTAGDLVKGQVITFDVSTGEVLSEVKGPLDFNFRSKCKRKSINGVTPCLLCAGPCWGEMLDEANDRAERWKDTTHGFELAFIDLRKKMNTPAALRGSPLSEDDVTPDQRVIDAAVWLHKWVRHSWLFRTIVPSACRENFFAAIDRWVLAKPQGA